MLGLNSFTSCLVRNNHAILDGTHAHAVIVSFFVVSPLSFCCPTPFLLSLALSATSMCFWCDRELPWLSRANEPLFASLELVYLHTGSFRSAFGFELPEMATRNLTPEFNKYRQGSGRKRPMNASTSSSASLIGGEMYLMHWISNYP